MKARKDEDTAGRKDDTAGPLKVGRKPRSDIDLHLAVAAALNPAGCQWSDVELAEFCGCHHSRIQQIERDALKKLRRRPSVMKLCLEALRPVRHMSLARARGHAHTDHHGLRSVQALATAA
jgi:hypothetical protein